MRSILKKLDRGQRLDAVEYSQLMEYAESLRLDSAESYRLFYDKYAGIIYKEYSTYLPRFCWGIDQLVNYLLEKPELIQELEKGHISWDLYPLSAHDYLKSTFSHELAFKALEPVLNLLTGYTCTDKELPRIRENRIVIKYEDSNPYKEIGLKAHFDRLSRYSFITRLQTYRYLTRNKARHDRIELVDDDRLGGIFTNKEKSIYYYIFLTEKDLFKAQNACNLLNLILYDLTDRE